MNLPIKEFETLLHKEMSRQEFLRLVGAGILGVVGVTTLVQNLQKLASSPQAKRSRTTSGYGMSPYGE